LPEIMLTIYRSTRNESINFSAEVACVNMKHIFGRDYTSERKLVHRTTHFCISS